MAFSAYLQKRLLTAKQMLNHGVGHGNKKGELNRLYSVLALDGAIENFLYTVVTELKGDLKPVKRQTFYEVLSAANDSTIKATTTPLPLISEITALHEARNGVQHNGTIPGEATAQRFIFYSSDFLRQSFSLCFQVEIDELHLADAIIDNDLRAILLKSEDDTNKGDYQESMLGNTYAFALLKSKTRKSEGWREKLGSFVGSRISDIQNGLLYKDRHERAEYELGQLLKSLVSETEYLNDKVEVLSLGANIQDYAHFNKKAPQVALMADGRPHFNLTGEKYDKHDCQITFNFVYNLVLTWESSLTG
jgi:hypothetical protein